MHSTHNEIREYWVRIPSYQKPDRSWQILVPFQPWHAVRIGSLLQNDLHGSGVDVKTEFPDPDLAVWQYDTALSHCTQALSKFNSEKLSDETKLFRSTLVAGLENLPGIEVGRPMLTPTTLETPRGRLSVELRVPELEMNEILNEVDTEIDSFIFVRELGFLCVENGLLDVQPYGFKECFYSMITGKRKPPGRVAEYWKTKPRDSLIYLLIEELRRRGFTPTRNDAKKNGKNQSGCDIVAKASVRAGLRGARSYAAMKQIYSKIKPLAQSAPWVKLREQSSP